jgi:hypothetical protein
MKPAKEYKVFKEGYSRYLIKVRNYSILNRFLDKFGCSGGWCNCSRPMLTIEEAIQMMIKICDKREFV